jgi:branched-chain amino acid transport system permease protein
MGGLFAESLLLGVLTGGLYALMACGLTLVFGVVRLINIAHAAIVILAAYLAWALLGRFGLDPLLAAGLIAVLFFAAGVTVHRGLLGALAERDLSLALLATLGVANIIEGGEGMLWTSTFHTVNPGYADTTYHVGPLYVPLVRLIAFAVALGLLLGLYVLLNHTRVGRAIRATTQNRTVAQLTGVDVQRVTAIAVGIGVATAGAAGPLVGMIYPFYPDSHWLWIAKLMAIVVLGGLGSIRGTLAAAMVLGIAEQVTILFLSPNWAAMVFFVFLFGALLVRPQGFFGHVERGSL